MGASSLFSHFGIGAGRTLAAPGASASRLPCRRLAVLTYAQVGLVPHRVQDVRHHEPKPSLGARLGDVLLPLAFVEPAERPGHLPGLLEDLLDQGSLMIVLDIQVEDSLIQVPHANKLLAAGSPQPDPFHRLAPFGWDIQHPTSSQGLAARALSSSGGTVAPCERSVCSVPAARSSE